MMDFGRLIDGDTLRARVAAAPRDADGGVVRETAEGIAIDLMKESIVREILSQGLLVAVSHTAANFAEALPEHAELRRRTGDALDAAVFLIDMTLESVRLFGEKVEYDLSQFIEDLRAMPLIAKAIEKAGPGAVDRGRAVYLSGGLTPFDMAEDRFAEVWAEGFRKQVESLTTVEE